MSNVTQLRNTGGFTRMDNDLYEALIGADLSGRELRVALAIHRFTAGYNVPTARIPAATIASLSGIARENVSRIIGELIRQRVIYRAGGSKAPIGICPSSEWKIDTKNEDKKGSVKTTQSVKNDTSLVSFPTHIKDRKDNLASTKLVDAAASTPSSQLVAIAQEQEPTASPDQPELKAQDRIPYEKIRELYNAILGGKLSRRLGTDEADRKRIRGAYNLKLNGEFLVRDGGLEFWEGLFNDAAECAFLLGAGKTGWRADFEFLTRRSSIQKFLEGKYDHVG